MGTPKAAPLDGVASSRCWVAGQALRFAGVLLRSLIEVVVHFVFPGISLFAHILFNEISHSITDKFAKEGFPMFKKEKDVKTACRCAINGHGAPALQAEPADEPVQVGRKGSQSRKTSGPAPLHALA